MILVKLSLNSSKESSGNPNLSSNWCDGQCVKNAKRKRLLMKSLTVYNWSALGSP